MPSYISARPPDACEAGEVSRTRGLKSESCVLSNSHMPALSHGTSQPGSRRSSQRPSDHLMTRCYHTGRLLAPLVLTGGRGQGEEGVGSQHNSPLASSIVLSQVLHLLQPQFPHLRREDCPTRDSAPLGTQSHLQQASRTACPTQGAVRRRPRRAICATAP